MLLVISIISTPSLYSSIFLLLRCSFFLSFFLQGFLITLLGIIAIPVTFFNHLRNTIIIVPLYSSEGLSTFGI